MSLWHGTYLDNTALPVFVKKGRTIDLSFWRVPERLLDEPAELLSWAGAALGAARWVAVIREGTAPDLQSPNPQQSPWGNLVDPLRGADSRMALSRLRREEPQWEQGAQKGGSIDRPAGSGRDGCQPVAGTIWDRLLYQTLAATAPMTMITADEAGRSRHFVEAGPYPRDRQRQFQPVDQRRECLGFGVTKASCPR